MPGYPIPLPQHSVGIYLVFILPLLRYLPACDCSDIADIIRLPFTYVANPHPACLFSIYLQAGVSHHCCSPPLLFCLFLPNLV